MGKKANISYLRVFATIAVLCSHVASTLVQNDFEMNQYQRTFFDTAMHLFKFGVPVFVMITGALLLQKDRVIKPIICLKKYCARIALALLIFGIPFAFLVLYFNDPSLKSFSILKLFIMLLNNEGLSHLWYLFLLIGIYCILPFVKTFTDNSDRKLLEYMLLVLFVLNSVLPFINGISALNVVMLPQLGIYLFYLLLGHYLLEYDSILCKKTASVIIILLMTGLIIYVGVKGGSLDIVMNYASPIDVILSAALFGLFKNISHESNDRIWKLDRLCFGVYLIHPVFIQFSYRYLKLTPVCNWYMIAFVVFSIVITILSFVGSWVLSLITPLKRYVL